MFGNMIYEDIMEGLNKLNKLEKIKAAGTITTNSEGKVLMLASTKYPGKWQFCGGKCNKGEWYLHTAVRETYEESGIIVVTPFLAKNEVFISDSKELGNVHYYCYYAKAVAGELKESYEGVPYWIDIDEVMKLDLVYPEWTRQCLEFYRLILFCN